MDPDVVQDPVFQQLLIKHERAARKLRDAVIAMRSFYLKHHKRPLDETTNEKWRGALLSEETSLCFERAKDAAADLLRYAYELAPHSNSALHMEEVMRLKLAHEKRLKARTGWGEFQRGARGIEEKVHVDDGPPITVVYKPSAYPFTDRAQRRKPAKDITDVDPLNDDVPGDESDDE